MSNLCDVQPEAPDDFGISSQRVTPMVLYKGQVIPMQPGMVIDPCFLPREPEPDPIPPVLP